MESSLYNDLVLYRSLQELPSEYLSTRSNFIALAGKFELNGANKLTRNGKIVVKKTDLDRNFSETHEENFCRIFRGLGRNPRP